MKIGKDAVIGDGYVAFAEKITLIVYVPIGANSFIVGTDFHSVSSKHCWSDLLGGKPLSMVIGNDVFNGVKSIIPKV